MTEAVPYRELGPTLVHADTYIDGSFTAEMAPDDPAAATLAAAEVAGRLVEGVRWHAQGAARLAGAEPLLVLEHLRGVVHEFIEATVGELLVVPGVTMEGGEPLALIVETNGAVLVPGLLDELAGDLGVEAKRLVWSIGVGATSPGQLAELSGCAAATAREVHARQVKALMHVAYKTPFGLHASFEAQHTDAGIFAALQREVERARAGLGRHLTVKFAASRLDPSRVVKRTPPPSVG